MMEDDGNPVRPAALPEIEHPAVRDVNQPD